MFRYDIKWYNLEALGGERSSIGVEVIKIVLNENAM